LRRSGPRFATAPKRRFRSVESRPTAFPSARNRAPGHGHDHAPSGLQASPAAKRPRQLPLDHSSSHRRSSVEPPDLDRAMRPTGLGQAPSPPGASLALAVECLVQRQALQRASAPSASATRQPQPAPAMRGPVQSPTGVERPALSFAPTRQRRRPRPPYPRPIDPPSQVGGRLWEPRRSALYYPRKPQ